VLSRGLQVLRSGMGSACDGRRESWWWSGELHGLGDELPEIGLALLTGRAETGKRLEGPLAALRLVAAGELSDDDGGTELTLGQVVGRIDAGQVQESQKVGSLLLQAIGDTGLGGVLVLGSQQDGQATLQIRPVLPKLPLVELVAEPMEDDGGPKQRLNPAEERTLRRLSSRFADRLEMMSTALPDAGRNWTGNR